MQEARAKIDNARTTFRAQAEDDLAKSRGDLAVLDENIKAAQDKVRRTELRSPVNGIVNKLNVTTVGAVVSPGGAVMEIVPGRRHASGRGPDQAAGHRLHPSGAGRGRQDFRLRLVGLRLAEG